MARIGISYTTSQDFYKMRPASFLWMWGWCFRGTGRDKVVIDVRIHTYLLYVHVTIFHPLSGGQDSVERLFHVLASTSCCCCILIGQRGVVALVHESGADSGHLVSLDQLLGVGVLLLGVSRHDHRLAVLDETLG